MMVICILQRALLADPPLPHPSIVTFDAAYVSYVVPKPYYHTWSQSYYVSLVVCWMVPEPLDGNGWGWGGGGECGVIYQGVLCLVSCGDILILL